MLCCTTTHRQTNTSSAQTGSTDNASAVAPTKARCSIHGSGHSDAQCRAQNGGTSSQLGALLSHPTNTPLTSFWTKPPNNQWYARTVRATIIQATGHVPIISVMLVSLALKPLLSNLAPVSPVLLVLLQFQPRAPNHKLCLSSLRLFMWIKTMRLNSINTMDSTMTLSPQTFILCQPLLTWIEVFLLKLCCQRRSWSWSCVPIGLQLSG